MIGDGMLLVAIRVVRKNFWSSHAWQSKTLCCQSCGD